MGLLDKLIEYKTEVPSFSIAGIGVAILAVLQYFVIHYIGDAARYLSPQPKNIAFRRAVRSEGIKLLRNIHESGDYDRVILVGHSLGSLIAYDILKHLWQEYHKQYLRPTKLNQVALQKVEKMGEALESTHEGDALEAYQESQIELWQELRDLGNPWLVTDLITLGSPLTHASLLLAQDDNDLKMRQRQRELPVSPPIPEIEIKGKSYKKKYSYQIWESFKEDGNEYKLRALHHAALFACTRWANIYFPTHLGLLGDFIGGPLRKGFGLGINDISVKTTRWGGLARFTAIAHTSYWWKNKKELTSQEKQASALSALIQALDLEGDSVYQRP